MTVLKPRDELAAVVPYPVGASPEERQLASGFKHIFRMADNENPYGPSPFALEAAKQELARTAIYPDGSYASLLGALSRHHHLSNDHFAIGNGSDEIIRQLTRAYISKGDEAIMADCTFPRYRTNVLIEGGMPVLVPLKDGVHNLEAMYEQVTPKTKMIFVCNPNNPTGTIVDKEALLRFIDRIPPNIMIVIDEAYVEYVTPGCMIDAESILVNYKNCVFLRTFSKVHGLAGLRVGYGMMDPGLANELKKVKDVYQVNRISAAAAAASLNDQEHVIESASKNQTEREYLAKSLSRLGYKPLPSEANFLFIPVTFRALLLEKKFAEKGIFIKALSSPSYPEGLRISLGTRKENDVFLAELCSIAPERVI
ncbi:histidinol-phosphate transaminase [Bacillus sp. FJAT-27225]|uniref:histidinol-phosphate transaminase n=1 Tax=Bacillus sp. FJAT-27225 TaxID=1743144 RepID=UPI00080C325A|nr:histidinol-phosphate transaminase [Bacillus sp. FJAT-27225]OCA90652.1 histidinol-phosphate transaminase [Bacillus sp. FJAT-27225]